MARQYREEFTVADTAPQRGSIAAAFTAAGVENVRLPRARRQTRGGRRLGAAVVRDAQGRFGPASGGSKRSSK